MNQPTLEVLGKMVETNQTVIQALQKMATRRPDAPALDYHGEQWSYQQLLDDAGRLARGLAERGIGHGDRVTVFSQNVPEHILVFFALAQLGAINAAINPQWLTDEAKYLIADAGSKMVIASPETLEVALRAVEGTAAADSVYLTPRSMDQPSPHAVERPEGVGLFEDLVGDEPFDEDVASPDDDVAFWYTSGTTGRPKGAIWTHRIFLNNALVTAQDCYGVIDGDAALCPIPVAHNGLSVAAVGPMLSGACLHLHRGVDPGDMLETMLEAPVTYMATAPAVMNILMLRAEQRGVSELPEMKTIAVGGAVITPHLLSRLEKFMPNCECCVIFAGSEAYYGTWKPTEAPEKVGSVGVPYPGMEWKVVDDDRNELPVGEVGNIMSRGPGVMRGYWNNPDATAEAIRDRWLIVGDLGRLDEDGFLWFAGRDRDVIDSGGFNVYASEVESVLSSVAGVGTVAVTGAPDEILGERIIAFAAPQEGHEVSEAALRLASEEKLAKYKRPSEYRIVEELPINSLGKVLKHRLPV